MDKDYDIVVMGSGAAGLTAALFAADRGAKVLVLEKTALLGGTSAVSGGQIWIPGNRFLAQGRDSRSAALEYLEQVTLGQTAPELLECFVKAAPQMVAQVERLTGLNFAMVDRADYHSEWPGAVWGRSLEPLPYDSSKLGAAASVVRRSPHRAPLTSAEVKGGADEALVQERIRKHEVTQGVALVCGLVQGCISRGVTLQSDCRVDKVKDESRGGFAVHFSVLGKQESVRGNAVILASGGFEWNKDLKHAFLNCPDEGAASPPANEGDGLRIGLQAGAAVDNMAQAWWSAAFCIPGESYEGQPLVRNIVRELALPGSILVNADGNRFANEASSYNALGKAFQAFDVQRNSYPNKRAWLVFDESFKKRYTVASVPATRQAPGWFAKQTSLSELAAVVGVDAEGLARTVTRFNAMASAGRDLDYGRGDAKHDQYHGDKTQPHSNLGSLSQAPFYAIPIFLGNLGTKGGVKTDSHGRIQDMAGTSIPGLFACGNVAASWMGPGYPGAGGSLGPIMTAAYLCGNAAAATVAGAQLEST